MSYLKVMTLKSTFQNYLIHLFGMYHKATPQADTYCEADTGNLSDGMYDYSRTFSRDHATNDTNGDNNANRDNTTRRARNNRKDREHCISILYRDIG